MRGCFLSLLLWLAGAALSVAAVMALLYYRFGFQPVASLGASIFAGGFAWLSLNLFRSAWRSWRDQAALAGGAAGMAPSDGRKSVLVGTLEPLAGTLAAPLDGSPSLVYSYEISEQIGSGRRSTIVTHYKGAGLAPSTVRTLTGNYLLLAMPEFKGAAQALDPDDARLAAERYLRSASFTSKKKTSAKELENRWSDDDGAYRSDVSYVEGAEVDLANCRFKQHRVRPGDKVCVFGVYSASRGGIVPHTNWGNITWLIPGDAEQAGATLGSSVKTHLVVALMTAAAAAGIVAAFVAG